MFVGDSVYTARLSTGVMLRARAMGRGMARARGMVTASYTVRTLASHRSYVSCSLALRH